MIAPAQGGPAHAHIPLKRLLGKKRVAGGNKNAIVLALVMEVGKSEHRGLTRARTVSHGCERPCNVSKGARRNNPNESHPQ